MMKVEIDGYDPERERVRIECVNEAQQEIMHNIANNLRAEMSLSLKEFYGALESEIIE